MERVQIFGAALITAFVFLSVMLYCGITNGNAAVEKGWSLSLDASPDMYYTGSNIHIGGDQTCYVSSANEINAIGADGKLKWSFYSNLSAPDITGNTSVVLSAADRNGWLYVVMTPTAGNIARGMPEIIAISPDGKIGWNVPLGVPAYEASLTIVGDWIYIQSYGFNQYSGNLKVLNLCGKAIWETGDADVSAVDLEGNVYVLAGSDLRAYLPDGSMLWTTTVPISRNAHSPASASTLSARNNTIYLWMELGTAAYEANGSLRWLKPHDLHSTAFEGFDGKDRMYLDHMAGDSVNRQYLIISPDGTEVNATLPELRADNSRSTISLSDGILYYLLQNPADGNPTDSLDSYTLVAYDVLSEQKLWSYATSLSNARTATLNESNAINVMYYYDVGEVIRDNRLTPTLWYQSKGVAPGTVEIRNRSQPTIVSSNGLVCFSYWAYKYEYPLFFDRTPCTYAGGAFAVDREGHLLWERSIDSYVTSMDMMNGTIVYQTGDGRVSSTGVSVIAGLIAAATYLFFQFFSMGTVARAKARLDKNEKRVKVLQFIVDRPGSTLHEIAKNTGVNVGTARYHLFVLSLNHKIMAHVDDTKFVRYFRNSGAYSEEEREIIGLCRRETLRSVLSAITSREGLTNVEIAEMLGVQESAVSRALRELVSRNVVRKTACDRDRPAYSIEEKYMPVVEAVLKGLDAEQPRQSKLLDTSTIFEV